MADCEDCLAISALGRAEEAHAEDAADEGGGQEKHRQDLDDSQCAAVLMRGVRNLCGFGRHCDVHLGGIIVSKTLPSQTGAHKLLHLVD